MLHGVEFTYNATCALGIEHTPFEAKFGFSHAEPPCLLLSMRLSTTVLQNASERLHQLRELHTLGRVTSTVLQQYIA
jgi:nucleotidyltransferase/DNA polymerase involved in DNA repair